MLVGEMLGTWRMDIEGVVLVWYGTRNMLGQMSSSSNTICHVWLSTSDTKKSGRMGLSQW